MSSSRRPPPGLLPWLHAEKAVSDQFGLDGRRIESAIESARAGDTEPGLRLLAERDPDLRALAMGNSARTRADASAAGTVGQGLEEGNPMARTVTREGITITGNPEGVPLHEALSAVGDWLDYEGEVVEAAADELADTAPEVAELAEDQAESMQEAAEAVEEAAADARETAAEVFTETGVPSDEQPAEVVSGNPEGTTEPQQLTPPEVSSIETSAMGNPIDTESARYEEGRIRGEAVRADILAEGGDLDDAPAPLSGEMGGESIPEIFGSWEAATEEAMDDYEAGYWGAVYGNPTSRQIVRAVRQTTRGNPGGTDVAPGTAAPVAARDSHAVAPAEASPPALTASGHATDAKGEIPPDPSHWYNRPLIRKG